MSIFEPVVRAVAGLYQATVTEVMDGQIRPARMTARRSLIASPDYQHFQVLPADINSANKVVNGVTFVNLYGLKLGSTNGTNYTNYTTARIYIPLAAAGFRNLEIMLYASNATYHNQNISLWISLTPDYPGISNTSGMALNITLPQSTYVYFTITSAGSTGYGGTVGGATASVGSVYSVPAMKDAGHIVVSFLAPAAPTSGAFAGVVISRSS